MALVTVQRSPSNSNSSSTISDNECDNEERVKKQCESFFAVKGAALVLPRSNESRPIKKNPIVGELSDHIQSMFPLLRSEDRMTLAVRLESMYEERIRYIILVSCNGIQDTEESIILGMDIMSNSATIGLVLPIWCETSTQLDGDGGFNICSKNRTHTFKPVSVQALWSAMQAIHAGIATAQTYNYFPGGLNLTWIGYYESRINSSPSRIKEWQLMPELQVTKPHAFTPTYSEDGHYYPSDRELTEQLIFVKLKDIMASADLDDITSREVRLKLEEDLGKDLREYRHYLDEQLITYMRQMDSASLIFDHIYLGSEWNASHLEELEANGVGYILNVTMEIDNFYPNRFIYHNVRLYDIESSELLKYWDETYKFLSKAKEKGSKALVHCKMGISRSAATVIAYAMKEYNWPLEKARSFVQRKRKCVNPNEGFLQQLQVYEGMLDASRQRHNKLWRSKSESSLTSSAECSQETIESTSSIEDLTDGGAPKTSGIAPQGPASQSTGPPSGLAPHTGHARRKSWSPKDSVAEAHFPSNVHGVPGDERKMSLLTGAADFMMLDADDCHDIQIVVPELPTPTSPTLTVPTEPLVLGQSEDRKPEVPLVLDIEPMDTTLTDAQPVPLGLGQVILETSLEVGESPSGFKDDIPELTSTPNEPGEVEQTDISPPSDTAESTPGSELNTNNNSATGAGASLYDPMSDIPPIEGTVRLRVTSIENQQLVQDVERSEVKGEEECVSTADSVFSDSEIPVSSGTVQKQKQDIEDRIKAKAVEKGSPPLTRSGKVSPETTQQPTSESTTSETGDCASADQPKLAESEDGTKPETETNNLSPSSPPTVHLIQETVATASPTLQAFETGRVKKITEQLLSQNSPTKDVEENEQLSSEEKRRSQIFESGSPPSDSPTKCAPPVIKSPHSTCRSSLIIETIGTVSVSSTVQQDNQSAESDTSKTPPTTEEPSSGGSPPKETFIKTFFGEEIPLEPGTVKRQTIDFEQLSYHSQLEELDLKREEDTKKETAENVQKAPDTSHEEEMVVIIRESSTNGKRKLEEEGSQNKHARVDQPKEVADSGTTAEEVEMKTDEDSKDEMETSSAYPEEGISSWKVGDVLKHTKQFEGLSATTEAADQSSKPALPVTCEQTTDAKTSTNKTRPEGDNQGQPPITEPSSGSSGAEEPSERVSQVEEDVEHGSEVTQKKKLQAMEGIRSRIEKLGLGSLRRTASIARISNERGSPVVVRRSDFSRPVSIKGGRPRSDTGTRSLESSPENTSQLAQGDLVVEERRKSAHAKLVTPRPDSMPLEFYLEKPSSVQIRPLSDPKPGYPVIAAAGTSDQPKEHSSRVQHFSEKQEEADKGKVGSLPSVSSHDSPVTGRRKQHGKTHPLSKLSSATYSTV